MGTKVKAKDIKNQAFLTTGTAPDYEITIPRETSYSNIDRMEILVNFHTNWSWTITLNVNWLGAKDTWLTSIANDSYYTLIYDLSQDKFIATEVWWTGWWWVYTLKTSKSEATNYQAWTKWWLLVARWSTTWLWSNISIYSDSNATPTTLVSKSSNNTYWSNADIWQISVPILPNEYYRVEVWAISWLVINFYE